MNMSISLRANDLWNDMLYTDWVKACISDIGNVINKKSYFWHFIYLEAALPLLKITMPHANFISKWIFWVLRELDRTLIEFKACIYIGTIIAFYFLPEFKCKLKT